MPKRVKSETHMSQKLRYNARSRKLAYNCGGRWNGADTARVMAHNIEDSELSGYIGRSIQAIQARRAAVLFRKGGVYV